MAEQKVGGLLLLPFEKLHCMRQALKDRVSVCSGAGLSPALQLVHQSHYSLQETSSEADAGL